MKVRQVIKAREYEKKMIWKTHVLDFVCRLDILLTTLLINLSTKPLYSSEFRTQYFKLFFHLTNVCEVQLLTR